MKTKISIVLIISPLILLLDQITKYLIVQNVARGEQISVFQNFFHIVHTRNTGAAFGILANAPAGFREPFFYIISVAALIFLFFFIKQTPNEKKGSVIAIAMILGGALGNITDRVIRGSVVDFLSLHWYDTQWIWPAFNVADSAISLGVIVLLLSSMFVKTKSN